MRKDILVDFNNLAATYNYKSIDTGLSNSNSVAIANSAKAGTYQLETYNSDTHTGDYRPAKSAYIAKYRRATASDSPYGAGKYEPKWVYKLKWKGDAKI